MVRGEDLYKVKVRLKNLVTGKRSSDDFDWMLYNQHYRGELKNIAKVHTQVLQQGNYALEDGQLTLKDAVLPLHPNHRLLYETVLQLNPTSVIELGCGGGDHLHNLSILAPDLELHGRDISNEQLNLLRERHTGLTAEVQQADITLPNPAIQRTFDIAYTQAVIMHIQTGNSHLVALSNLFKFATKQVVLVENWTRHKFVEDIRMLHSKNVIGWDNVYFYYRVSPELRKPHLLVVSATPLAEYPELTDYSVFLATRYDAVLQ